jgi:PAS domain S-box-containing protein
MTNNENTDLAMLGKFALFSRWSGPFVALIGLIVVIAQLADINALTLTTGGVAVCFLMGGTALYLLAHAPRSRLIQGFGYVLSAMMTTLALLNISRYFFHLEISNFVAGMTVGDFEVARLIAMPPSDAIALFLIGLVLLLTPVKIARIRPAEALAFAATLICVMTLLGVLLRVDTFCAFMSCARISPLGESIFAVLCIGALLARSDGQLCSLLASRNAGGTVARILIPSALIVPILSSWVHTLMAQSGVAADVSLTLMIFGMVLCFSIILGWCAWSLERTDKARQQATMRLLQSEKSTRMIVQQAIDSFIAVDNQGLIKNWNDRAEYTFGWSQKEAIGQSIFETVIPPRFCEQARDILSGPATVKDANEALKPTEAMARHRDGHEFSVELSFFPVLVDEEKMFCAFVRDITERKEIEQRMKEFYSTVSHELRSPLTSIAGSVSIIKETVTLKPNDPVVTLLDIAEKSLERLIRLINDLLDIKRIEEGHFDLELQSLDSNEIVAMAVSEMQSLAAQSQVRLVSAFDHRAVLSGDSDRVVQVLTNLIANAVKFSPAGAEIVVRVQQSRNPNRVRVTVEDQGPGILPADAQKLFSKFSQLADGRKKLGTGLGLAISKAIVVQHGGEIGVEGQAGKGSIFWFELPLSADAEPVQPEQMRTLSTKALTPRIKMEAEKDGSSDLHSL